MRGKKIFYMNYNAIIFSLFDTNDSFYVIEYIVKYKTRRREA